MSDQVYSADGGISRYLLQSPSLESNSHVLAVPGGGEPAATHVVGAPQHVPPPVQAGVDVALLPTAAPTPAVSLSMAFGNDDVQNNHGAMPVDDDVHPLQGEYGFPPADRVRAAPAGDDGMRYSEANHLDHNDNVLPELLGNLSLHDHYSMDDGGDRESAEDADNNNGSDAVEEEHAVLPVEEALTFVRFVPGQLDCSMCRSVREVLHESANHKLYFIVHVVGDDPTAIMFQHAIFDRAYIDAMGQTVLNELTYVDLRDRTHGYVQNFIANCVEILKDDTSGTLTDSCSTSDANNDKHIELELDMLREILSAPSSNSEPVGVTQSGPEVPHQTVTRAEENTNAGHTVLNTANWPEFSPPILESSQVNVQDGMMASSSDASATNNESQLAKQRRRIAKLTIEDIAKLLHMSKKDAANKLDISMTSLKRLCRKNNADRWPARQIKSIETHIKKLRRDATKVGTIGMFAIKDKIDKLENEKAQIYASFLKNIKESHKRNDRAGDSSG